MTGIEPEGRNPVEQPGFGDVLARLLAHRRVDAAWLSAGSGVPEDDLRSVLAGEAPHARQLEALAPALGLRTADLYVIAGLPAPEALVHRSASGAGEVVTVVRTTMALPAAQRSRVRRLVEELPGEGPADEGESPRAPGRELVAMLCGNRNLVSPVVAAKVLASVTASRVFLSPSTVNGIFRGRLPLRPEVLRGFAAVLGIAPGDLAAIVGLGLPDAAEPEHPLADEMAELVWDCRLLTSDQLVRVAEEARSMLVPVPAEADAEGWNRVYHQGGTWWGAPASE